VLNEAGYSLMSGGRTADARAVFEANLALYPADETAVRMLARMGVTSAVER
jgi:hypothetical protein